MTHQEEILTKIQMLHQIIDTHPFLSGMMEKDFHGFLDDVVNSGWSLKEVPFEKWRETPDPEKVDKVL